MMEFDRDWGGSGWMIDNEYATLSTGTQAVRQFDRKFYLVLPDSFFKFVRISHDFAFGNILCRCPTPFVR